MRVNNISGFQVICLVILMPILTFVNTVDSSSLESYIRKNYLRKDKIYEAVPTNRFRSIGKVSERSLVFSKNEEGVYWENIALINGFFKVSILENGKIVTERIQPAKGFQIQNMNIADIYKRLPFSEDINKDIYFTSLFETKFGAFLFYRLNRLNVVSDRLVIDDLNDKERCFVEGFVLISNGSVLAPTFHVKKVDPETGGYTRKLWDVFEFEKQRLVLIYHQVYESFEFEVYRIKDNSIELIMSFQFGGL